MAAGRPLVVFDHTTFTLKSSLNGAGENGGPVGVLRAGQGRGGQQAELGL